MKRRPAITLIPKRPKPTAFVDGNALLREVATHARLAEGAEGVRRILRTVFVARQIPIRNIAQQVGLPVPVVAAVRGELEKRGILTRKGGVSLSDEGLNVVQSELGISCRKRFARPSAPPTPAILDDVRERLAEIAESRPKVDVKLDQSHATPETVLKRAVYLYEHDALEGRNLLVLGDDDLTSVAVGLLAQHLEIALGQVVVLECDRRLIAFLDATHQREGLPVTVIARDLREDLPASLCGQMDVFFTDPPYTLPGLALFVSRGAAALAPEVGKRGFVSFGRRPPAETAQALASLIQMGFAPVEIVPEFNEYVGAQVLGGVSQMIHLISTGKPQPLVTGRYHGPLYTADCKRRRRRDRASH